MSRSTDRTGGKRGDRARGSFGAGTAGARLVTVLLVGLATSGCSNPTITSSDEGVTFEGAARKNLSPRELLRTHDKALDAAALARAAGGTPAEPGTTPGNEALPLPTQLHFAPDVDHAELLPLRIRRQKVAWVTGAPPVAFAKLDGNRYLLGDYDFSKGIQEQRAWSDPQIRLWLESILAPCESQEFRAKYAWPGKAAEFVADALGRAPLPADTEALDEIAKMPLSDAEKRTVTCLTYLSSLEFLTF